MDRLVLPAACLCALLAVQDRSFDSLTLAQDRPFDSLTLAQDRPFGSLTLAQDRPFGSLTLAQDRPPTFRAATRTVPVYATVQGRDGRLVPDLTRSDFRVFEDGRERPLTVFDNTPQAITIAVMFDMSNSMARQYRRIREAASAFVAALWPDDRARIGSFGLEVAISPLLTSDKAVLHRVLDEELWPGGPTPLWYASDLAMKSLDNEPGRRVVLLFTDGEDSGLFVPGSRGATRRHAEDGGFMVYAVGLPRGDLSEDVQSLAASTGGGHFIVKTEDDLASTFARVVEELHHQYVLGFTPETLDGRSHEIEVKTTRSGAKVRARKSYVAVAEGAVR
jgi:VWFA-related protein